MEENKLAYVFERLTGVLSGPPKTWLRVTGPDAAAFLHGQCTQDVNKMIAGETRRALWLTTKGRVTGESLVLRGEGEQWFLWSESTDGAALKARLEDFIIADDVMVDDLGADGSWEQVTLAGADAERWLRAGSGGIAPPAEGRWVVFRGGMLFGGRRGLARVWEWVRPAAGGGDSLEWAGAGLADLPPEALVRARLAAGVAAIPSEFGPADLPQEAGLETVAISFTKGCYLGQEVMARLHAMGQVRRRLIRVSGAGPVPAAGVGLVVGSTGKRVGEVRVATDDGGSGWLGLAMVNLLGLDCAVGLVLETDGTRGVTMEDAL